MTDVCHAVPPGTQRWPLLTKQCPLFMIQIVVYRKNAHPGHATASASHAASPKSHASASMSHAANFKSHELPSVSHATPLLSHAMNPGFTNKALHPRYNYS